MTERIIDNELRLIPYYRNDEASLPWYQDLDVCRQVDNREKPYDVELLLSVKNTRISILEDGAFWRC